MQQYGVMITWTAGVEMEGLGKFMWDGIKMAIKLWRRELG